MKYLVIEQAAALLSSVTASPVMLLQLGMDFGEMDGLQVRDLADLRPIITQEAFDDLCNHQSVMLHAETSEDVKQITWAADALGRIIPHGKAPVTALLFIDGTLVSIMSAENYSVPSSIKVAADARA